MEGRRRIGVRSTRTRYWRVRSGSCGRIRSRTGIVTGGPLIRFGQRVGDSFSLRERVFLAGDAVALHIL
jgi:hypothetical protein